VTQPDAAGMTSTSPRVGKPDRTSADPKEILLGFLDYYRWAIANKIDGLSDGELRSSHLPSGWTPIQLVKHLTFMERRWFRWGFLAEAVPDPFGDHDDTDRWAVDDAESISELVAALLAGGAVTRSIVERADLSDRAAVGGRFAESDVQPTLAWILAYVVQEYARHAGHLDVARELVDQVVGE
jgi:uncharacterized damage-inducible protein DinB